MSEAPDLPFADALRGLIAQRRSDLAELSLRLRELDPLGPRLNAQYLADLVHGREPPTDHVIDLMAKVFGLPREYFVEARPVAQAERQPTTTSLPFADALRGLMTKNELTFRGLAQQLKRHDPDRRGFSHSHLVNLAHGRDQPSERALNLTATVFGLPEYYFVEHRLIVARDRLDPETHGFESAQAEVDAIRQVHPYYPRCPPWGSIVAPAGSVCYHCKTDPREVYGDGGGVLLQLHDHDHGLVGRILMCPSCHAAMHLGLISYPPRASGHFPDEIYRELPSQRNAASRPPTSHRDPRGEGTAGAPQIRPLQQYDRPQQ